MLLILVQKIRHERVDNETFPVGLLQYIMYQTPTITSRVTTFHPALETR